MYDKYHNNDMTGEDGIRTHAPFRTNGFQDRLVMTASIPLHKLSRMSGAPDMHSSIRKRK